MATSAAFMESAIGRRLGNFYLSGFETARSVLGFITGQRIPALLAALSAVFAGVILYALVAPIEQFHPPKITLPKLTLPRSVEKPFVPPVLQQFSEIDERPLFSPARHPPKQKQDAAAPALQPPSFALVGVILEGETRIAITKAPGANASVDVTAGQTVDGWQVMSIEADHMELRANATGYELKLQSPSGPPAPARPQPAPSTFEPAPSPLPN